MSILYLLPKSWVAYDAHKILPYLAEAKAALIALVTTLYQRDWVEDLETIQLKMEVDGTSRIEGDEFTPQEFDVALSPDATLLG